MGQWHAYFAARSGAKVAAIVDRDLQAAEKLSRRFRGADVFEELSTCLSESSIDAVHICTPTNSHGPLAELAMKFGKHVLIEKPIAQSFKATERIVAMADTQKIVLCPVHQFPFQKGFRQLQKTLPLLGDPVHVSYCVCTAGAAGLNVEERRTLLLEILPHAVSLISNLGDLNFDQIAWSLSRFTDDELNLVGREKALLIDINISLRGRPTRNELRVTGSKATATVDLFHGYCFQEPGKVSRWTKILRPFRTSQALLWAASVNLIQRVIFRKAAYPGLDQLISGFYDAITQSKRCPISHTECLASAKFVDNIKEMVIKAAPDNGQLA